MVIITYLCTDMCACVTECHFLFFSTLPFFNQPFLIISKHDITPELSDAAFNELDVTNVVPCRLTVTSM